MNKERDKIIKSLLEKVKERMASYNCHIVKKFSMDAVKEFNDESLDFLYIDCNHSFVHIAQDLWYWSKKVRKGGVVSGHDYSNLSGKEGLNACHVKYVVDAWVKTHDIKLFITKENNPSWFYVKK